MASSQRFIWLNTWSGGPSFPVHLVLFCCVYVKHWLAQIFEPTWTGNCPIAPNAARCLSWFGRVFLVRGYQDNPDLPGKSVSFVTVTGNVGWKMGERYLRRCCQRENASACLMIRLVKLGYGMCGLGVSMHPGSWMMMKTPFVKSGACQAKLSWNKFFDTCWHPALWMKQFAQKKSMLILNLTGVRFHFFCGGFQFKYANPYLQKGFF